MRRPILVGTLVLLLILAGAVTAQAASLAGKWTATYQQHPLILQLKGSGNSYTGTYTFMTKYKVKNVSKTAQTVFPVKASVKVVNNITNVILTFTKSHTTSNCALIKGSLRCIAPANQKVIVFTHVHS